MKSRSSKERHDFGAVLRVASSILVLFLASCRSEKTETLQPRTNLRLGPILIQDFPDVGWRMLPAPTTGDAVGTILDVDSEGVTFRADFLRGLAVETNSVALPEVTQSSKRSANLGALLSFFSATTLLKMSSSNSLDRTVTVKMKISDAIEESAFAADIVSKLPPERLSVLSTPAPILGKGQDLFVIVKTLSAKNFELEFDRNELKDFGLDGSFNQLANLNPNIVWTNATTTSLRGEFSTYRRIFYLPRRVARVGEKVNLQPVKPHDLIEAKGPAPQEGPVTNDTGRPKDNVNQVMNNSPGSLQVSGNLTINPRPKKGLRLLATQYSNSGAAVQTTFKFGSEVEEQIGHYSITLLFAKPYEAVSRDFELLTPNNQNGGFDGESYPPNTDKHRYKVAGTSIFQSYLVLTFTAPYKMEIHSLEIVPPPEN